MARNSDGVYNYRKFNGVKYQLFSTVGTKTQADDDVRILHKRGHKARITKREGGAGYRVWWAPSAGRS